MNIDVTCGCIATVLLLLATQVSADPVVPLEIGKQKQLFVDDYIVQRMDGVQKTMNRPKKHPDNPVLAPDRPWESNRAHMYGSVIYDRQTKLFKMWYWTWVGTAMSGAYATSKDGIHWDKPELGQVEFQGSKRNNRVGWMAMGMIHSPDDPDPGKRYKSIHGRQGAFSADGIKFRVPPDSKDIPGPIISDNVIPFVYDELSKRYVAFPKINLTSGGHLRRSVSVSFSDDFLTWTPVKPILVPDARDDELARKTIAAMRDRVEYDDGPQWHLAQFYGLCGFPYEGMYLGLLWVFDISGWGEPLWGEKDFVRHPAWGGEDGPMYVQLTSSRDLVNWERVGNRQPFIPLGAADSYDSGQIYTTNRPIVVGDEIWIYYAGWESTHGHPIEWATETDRFPKIAQAIKSASPRTGSAINLAKLRLDGWVSVDAGNTPGTVTTKPLVFDGSRLVINANASGGSVAVEVLDKEGKAIAGLDAGACRTFRGDSVRHEIIWTDGAGLAALAGKPVRLRFHLANARLYAFGFK